MDGRARQMVLEFVHSGDMSKMGAAGDFKNFTGDVFRASTQVGNGLSVVDRLSHAL